MTLYYEEEGELKLSLPCEELARTVIEAALDDVGCPYEAEVNLLLTMNEQIHEMNLEFRGIDRATDVLSFPMVDYEQPGEFDFLEEADEYFHPETGELCVTLNRIRSYRRRGKTCDGRQTETDSVEVEHLKINGVQACQKKPKNPVRILWYKVLSLRLPES